MVLPYILLVLFVIALAVYCSRSRRKPFSYELISKMSCSALFVLTALALRAEFPRGDSLWFTMMLAALLLSFLGDLFLVLRRHPAFKKNAFFLVGGLCFLLTHCCLCALYMIKAGFHPLSLLMTAAIVLFAAFMAKRVKLSFRSYKYLALIYSIVISFMLCCSVFLLQGGAVPLALCTVLGSLLFLISDCFLAFHYFSHTAREWIGTANAITYFCGQMLLAWSIAFV